MLAVPVLSGSGLSAPPTDRPPHVIVAPFPRDYLITVRTDSLRTLES